MAASTRIAAAQDALRTLVAGRANLATLEAKKRITVGWPSQGPDEEHIWISGDVTDWRQEWELTGAGTQAREERFVLTVHVLATKTGADYAAARDRVLALIAEVEAALRASLTLSGSVFDAEMLGGQLEEQPSEDGRRQVVASLRVGVHAFLV